MQTIENVEVFAVGTWNGQTFSAADLDEQVRAFNELSLAGKLPVKLGHTAPDTDPAQGWITRLRRVGDKLMATLAQVPDSLVDAIKQGRYRHVSIELLQDVTTRDGQRYAWVPDGLAILGAARPAVDVLQGLHKLVASALPGLAFRERRCFTVGGDESEQLRAELERTKAALHANGIRSQMTADVLCRSASRAATENFKRIFRLNTDEDYARVTVEDWHNFARTQVRPPSSDPASLARSPTGRTEYTRPDEEVLARITELRDKEPSLTFSAASRRVLMADRDLAERYRNMPGER